MDTKKKRKKRRRVLKRIRALFLLALFASLLVFGCVSLVRAIFKPKQAILPAEELVETGAVITAQPAEPSPVPTPFLEPTIAPTESPVPEEPEPTPLSMPEPTINEKWYIRRNEDLYYYMKRFGDYANDDEIYRQIALWQIDPSQKKVAFTFDDGPYSPYSGLILDVLQKYNIRATFFVKGAYLELPGNDATIKRELALGCEIGVHTMNHDNLEDIPEDQVKTTIKGVLDILKRDYGYTSHLLRPPYIAYGKKGSERRSLIVDVCKKYELAIVNHTRSGHDSHEEYTARMIYKRLIDEKDEMGKGIDNSIFLLHDKYQKTVDAIDMAIPVLLEKGYQFVTVSELLQCSQEGFHYGWIYSKAD